LISKLFRHQWNKRILYVSHRTMLQIAMTVVSVLPRVKIESRVLYRRFASIFDCCRYLGQLHTTQPSGSTGVDLRTMVCLLTGLRINSSDASICTKELIADARHQGKIWMSFNRLESCTLVSFLCILICTRHIVCKQSVILLMVL
jgi:hypothetical protein